MTAEEMTMDQIPLPKHVSERIEQRWAASRFSNKKRSDDADVVEAKLARLRASGQQRAAPS
jgi:hypothetical protein